jgi:hypothetical protein
MIRQLLSLIAVAVLRGFGRLLRVAAVAAARDGSIVAGAVIRAVGRAGREDASIPPHAGSGIRPEPA